MGILPDPVRRDERLPLRDDGSGQGEGQTERMAHQRKDAVCLRAARRRSRRHGGDVFVPSQDEALDLPAALPAARRGAARADGVAVSQTIKESASDGTLFYHTSSSTMESLRNQGCGFDR